jgi:hypothetical protein
MLPAIAGRRASLETVSIAGTLVAVVPSLATDGPSAERMRAVADKLEAKDALDENELDAILGDQEVMYIVVGKWPPPRTTRAKPPPPLSEPAQELVDALRQRDVVTLVVGPWPPQGK